MREAVWPSLKALWREPRITGIERLFETLLLVLRLLSLSYTLKRFLPEPDSSRRAIRTSVVDAYCVLQLVVLAILVSTEFSPAFETAIAAYILFDIYLNLLNIIFIGKIRSINAPPASVERSLLLLLMNVVQVTLAFGVFYRHCLGLSDIDALFSAVLVLGTIGYPSQATGQLSLLVSLQVLLDLVLLVLILSSFVGQVTLFRQHADAGQIAAAADPLRPPWSSSPGTEPTTAMRIADRRAGFVRWQSTAIAQLTYAANLILTLSVAALGFQMSLLLDGRFAPVSWQKCAFSLSLLLLLVSTGIGIWCVINRLRDFRATARAARLRQDGRPENEIQPYRVLYERLGRTTWWLFWWQIGAFGVAILLAVGAVAPSFWSKLM